MSFRMLKPAPIKALRWLLYAVIFVLVVLLYRGARWDYVPSWQLGEPALTGSLRLQPSLLSSLQWSEAIPVAALLEHRVPELVVFADKIDQWLLHKFWLASESLHLQASTDATEVQITSLDWPAQIVIGEAVDLLAELSSQITAEPTRLELIDPWGRLLESTELSGEGSIHWQIKPPLAGRWMYQLMMVEPGQTKRSLAPLPLVVTAPHPAKLLLLSRGASFESRHLKSLLRRSGYQLDVVQNLATDFSHREGREQQPRLSKIQWSGYQLVFLELDFYQSQSSSWKKELHKAISLGLSVVWLSGGITQDEAQGLDWIRWQPDQTSTLSAYELAKAWKFDINTGHYKDLELQMTSIGLRTEHPGYEPTPAQDFSNGRLHYGKGKMIVAPLEDAFRLKLAGYPEIYQDYWRRLIHQVARPRDGQRDFQSWPEHLFTFQKSLLCRDLTRDGLEAPQSPWVLRHLASGQDHDLGFKQVGARQCLSFLPRLPGWYLWQEDGNSQYFYVYDQHELPGLRFARMQGQLALWRPAPSQDQQQSMPAEIPRGLVFMGLAASLGCLWWLRW